MKLLSKLVLIALSLVVAGVDPAAAASETWTFQGVVIGGPNVGNDVSGWLTLDPDVTPGLVSTDGATYSLTTTNFYPPFSSLQVSGYATDGTNSFIVGNGPGTNLSQVDVYKNFTTPGAPTNQYVIIGQSGNFPSDVFIQLATYAYNGGGTGIFSQPGLAPDQPVNWFSDGAKTRAYIGSPSFGTEIVNLTSVTESLTPVPEPASVAMLLVGLAVIALAKRRKATQMRQGLSSFC